MAGMISSIKVGGGEEFRDTAYKRMCRWTGHGFLPLCLKPAI